MLVLGIESSCDETGVALISDTEGLLADALHTQIDMHRAYGGVVPELASRDHIRRAVALADVVLEKADRKRSDIDAVAVTEGPGLAGALLVGASVGHAIGWALDVPVIGINHMEGHLLAARLADPKPEFPFLALLVSGGHTQFMKVEAFGKYELLGETLDDAAGEAFDKTAQLLGLPYPGGPAVSALAEKGTPGAVELSRPMIHSPNLDMSFSGLKTSVLTAVTKAEAPNDETFRADLARGFVDAVTDVLSQKLIRAMRMTKMTEVVVAGGVSANKQLRAALTDVVRRRRGRIYFPPMRLCTDNGAMIAAAGLARLQSMTPEEIEACRRSTSFGVKPRWSLAGR
ncbi:tRNA (adenosine(37)-N6)-threonylcarbamoyltransferase complex transferase subunit TsaD [Sutterella massiliensis]|uniref:tRNA N6-adenosine threonylcarbamoyltransferase n=1 Tax=Sutterella massiliensis TaxID=1816689 RepID=A0ABS2DQU5_9BURK|nr:tRNA (adenosine(37)-N6)-threonylcarbamoyltransferase complex transferase subunit TsaD [Sutterella massiliensis]MBM6703716.1 tRNA (adenosine(37)-N6)-threonylcarbamoyltransferase complex transferase subunit TsaD [Sutterella massiliensis]